MLTKAMGMTLVDWERKERPSLEVATEAASEKGSPAGARDLFEGCDGSRLMDADEYVRRVLPLASAS